MPKILMIDDDASMLGMTRQFLTAMGWTFTGAKDARSGLALLAREKPDVILLDVNLPDMDGFAVCSRLKGDPATRNIPIVLFSGDKKRAEDILRGLDTEGADSYILKPVHPLVLKSKLEAVMRPSGKA